MGENRIRGILLAVALVGLTVATPALAAASGGGAHVEDDSGVREIAEQFDGAGDQVNQLAQERVCDAVGHDSDRYFAPVGCMVVAVEDYVCDSLAGEERPEHWTTLNCIQHVPASAVCQFLLDEYEMERTARDCIEEYIFA